jgi:uncharacterized protein YcfJ
VRRLKAGKERERWGRHSPDGLGEGLVVGAVNGAAVGRWVGASVGKIVGAVVGARLGGVVGLSVEGCEKGRGLEPRGDG